MSHAKNKVEWCLKKAERELKESEMHRGLVKLNSDKERAKEHIGKAEHYLSATIYLKKGNFSDISASTVFYAMYHCLLAILAKNGYESRNQECTFAAVESLIKSEKIDLDVEQLRKIASFEEDLEKEDIVTLREESQYGTEAIEDTDKIRKLKDDTKAFIETVREVLSG